MSASTDAPPAIARTTTIVMAIVLATLFAMAISLYIPVLAIAMERSGVSATLSGINTAMVGLGTIAIAPFVPRIADAIGVRATLAIAVVVSSVSAAGFIVAPFWAWFPLRFVLGAAIGTMFVLSEFWINAAAVPERRGMIMGIYGTSLSVGFAAGPALMLLAGADNDGAMLIGALILLLGLVPVALAGARTPPIGGGHRPPILKTMAIAPIATFAGLLFGAVETGAFALLPVYGLRQGFGAATATIMISAVAAGNILSQVPLGWLSDRMDRRLVLLGCAVVGLVGAGIMPFAGGSATAILVILFVWGGFVGGIYAVGLAHLGARFTGPELAAANAAFVMLYSLGSVAGPPLIGQGMDRLGQHGLPVTLGALFAAYALLIAIRMTRRQA